MKYNNLWYNNLKQSPLTPPSWTFSIVWPILYVLIFISMILVWSSKKCYPFCYPLIFFFIQLFFNIIWTTLFFKLKKPFLALIDILLILIFTIITLFKFYPINKFSFYLLIPYFFVAMFCDLFKFIYRY